MNILPKIYKEDPKFTMPGKFLSDEVYAQAMESFVVVCTDTIIINKKRKTFYLTKRSVYPLKTWWMVGGRMLAGENPLESIRRCFLRETGIDVNPQRFTFIVFNRYILSYRKQEPRDTGSDSLAHVFSIELSDEEIQKISRSLNNDEYDSSVGLVEFNREKLIKEKVFSAIVDLYDQVF